MVISEKDKEIIRQQIKLDPLASNLIYGIGLTWPEDHPKRELYNEYIKIKNEKS